jgi:hypothetical protein
VEALAGDGEGHLVPTPVRREKIKASKRELALEADRVLKQADSVASLHSDIPPKRQPRSKPVDGEPNQSLQRKSSFGGTDSKKWNSEGKNPRCPNYYFETRKNTLYVDSRGEQKEIRKGREIQYVDVRRNNNPLRLHASRY